MLNRYTYAKNNPLRFTDPSGNSNSDTHKTKLTTEAENNDKNTTSHGAGLTGVSSSPTGTGNEYRNNMAAKNGKQYNKSKSNSFQYSGSVISDFTRMVGHELFDYGADIASAPGDYYNVFREAGLGPIGAGMQAANFTVGKVFGYSTLAEGFSGVDVRSVRVTEGTERAMQIVVGATQTGLSVIGTASAISKFSGSAHKVGTYSLEPTHGRIYGKNKMRKLANDIKQNGIRKPIKYYKQQGTNYIIDGHHRVRAAKMSGIKKVPSIKVPKPDKW